MTPESNELTIVYAARYRGVSRCEPHTHSIFQLYVLNSDRMKLSDGGSWYRPDHTREIVFIRPTEEHALILERGAHDLDWLNDEEINCALDCKFEVREGKLRDALMKLPRIINVGDTSFFKSLSNVMISALEAGDLSSADRAFGTFLYALTNRVTSGGGKSFFYTANDRWRDSAKGLNAVKEYIDCNYRKKISLNDVVKMSRMNRSALCREFKKTYKTTPIHYILQRRVEEAKVYLAESAVGVAALSERLGFSSASYFNRVFKKFEGISPVGYRLKHQSKSQKT